MKDLFKHYLYPIATLSGSIIGVGFLSLPYITVKVGIWPMLLYVIALTALIIMIHLIFAEVCLKTPDFKRWPGFVGFYLGKWAKRAVLIPMILGGFGVMLVYLLIGSQFLTTIFMPLLGGSSLQYMMGYFIVASIVIYFGVGLISKVEFWALSLVVISLLLVFFKGFSSIHLTNIFPSVMPVVSDWRMLFLPYGAVLFSLWGTGLIPETEEMLRGRKKSLKKVIVIGTLVPAVLYVVFILLIVSITGAQTTESALVGLEAFLGFKVVALALFIGVITTFTAFIAEGLLLKRVFMYDLGVTSFPAWAFTCFPALILLLLGFNSFIPLISFIGGVLLSIDGILILLMYKKIGGKKWVLYPLIIFFVLGVIYELIFFIK